MRVSRDEGREIVCTALLLTLGLRMLAGVIEAVQEIDRGGTVRSVIDRFLSHSGSTTGMLALGAAAMVVISPTGSITPRLTLWTERIVGLVAAIGTLAALNALTTAGSSVLDKIEFALRNGFAAAVLAGAGWWILHNFDPAR